MKKFLTDEEKIMVFCEMALCMLFQGYENELTAVLLENIQLKSESGRKTND